MKLEDYFDFLSPDDIRLKGTRVGIETILYDFVHRSLSPEEIAAHYTSVSLEQVYATITYYLHNKDAVSTYLADWLAYGDQMREKQNIDPSPAIKKLRHVLAERRAEYHP